MSDQQQPFGGSPYPGPPVPPPPPVSTVTPYTPPTPAPHRRRGLGLLATVLVAGIVAEVVGAFAGLAGYVVGRSVDDREATTAESTAGTSPDSSTTVPLPSGPVTEGAISQIAASTLPAVVSILVDGEVDAGSGSGFVIRPNGYILTNNHVVSVAGDSGTLTVVFTDGERAEGTVVGTNPSYDLAVVKVQRTGLPTVALGDSTQVRVGDQAIAIGAPLGLDGTVTSGIVSALDRPVTAGDSAEDVSFINAIQTDAAINPGNSGGPLLNANGDVIGVNSAIATLAIGGEAGNIGLGFAIPSNSAKRIADEIIETGRSRTPLMGVQLDNAYTGTGAQVDTVTAGSGADDAGLRQGDIIRQIDDRTIDDATELVVAIRTYAPGDTIEVGYERGGQQRTATLVLGDDSQGS
jgi:putative serine protease PepD